MDGAIHVHDKGHPIRRRGFATRPSMGRFSPELDPSVMDPTSDQFQDI